MHKAGFALMPTMPMAVGSPPHLELLGHAAHPTLIILGEFTGSQGPQRRQGGMQGSGGELASVDSPLAVVPEDS